MWLWHHPTFEELRELLTVDLPPDVEGLFRSTADSYNDRSSGTAFNEIRQRGGEEAGRRMYSLLNEGVQEGLRSAVYHLGRLQWLVQEVQRAGKVLMNDVKPVRPTSLGLSSQALTSEYESFTLISRATLDRLCWFFRAYFGTNAGNLYRLKAELANNRRGDARAERLIAAIERHTTY